MERNKIIAVAVLAIGIIAWRVGAMEQGGQAQAGQEMITVYQLNNAGNEESVQVPWDQLRLFEMFSDMRGYVQEMNPAEANRLPLSNTISMNIFKTLLAELPWAQQVRINRQQNETEEQAAKRMAKTMPAVAFNRDRLSALAVQLKAADFLQQQPLIELYTHQIVGMIMSEASMRLLSQVDKKYGHDVAALVNALPPELALHIVKSMPRAAIWLEQHTIAHDKVTSVAISADGNKVVTGSVDHTAKIFAWNGNAWVEDHTIRHADIVNSVAISADGNRVVTGSWDRTAKIVVWDGAAWIEQHMIRHNNWVNSVAISADGNKVVTGSVDHTAKIFAWNGNAWIEEHTIRHNNAVDSVAISADGNKVVTGSVDHTAKIFAWNGNAWVEEHTIRHNNAVDSVAISADGNRVVTGADERVLRIFAWDGNAWREQHTLEDSGKVYLVAISADGNTVVGISFRAAKIVGWNGNAWIEQPPIAQGAVNSVAISADGKRVVTGSDDGTAKIFAWNGNAWIEQHTIVHDEKVMSVAISADGNRAVAGYEGPAKIVGLVSRSLPGISDLDTCLFEHLLLWAKRSGEKISKFGWAGDILRSIQWRAVEPVAREQLQKLIRETMQHAV